MRLRNPDELVLGDSLFACQATIERDVNCQVKVHVATCVNAGDCLENFPKERISSPRH